MATVVLFTTPGTTVWVAPPGVTSIDLVECWGGGGAGGGATSTTTTTGGGGGGGEYAASSFGQVAVTPGVSYNVVVGAGGTGAAGTTGGSGVDSTFTGDSLTITANGGTGGSEGTNGAAGAGGTGSAAAVHFDGGAGANGVTNTRGGGGGSSAAAGTAGNPGSSSTGGSAPAGGGPGGNGATIAGNGNAPGSGPGGGGGGARGGTALRTGGAGFAGQVQITYTQAPQAQPPLIPPGFSSPMAFTALQPAPSSVRPPITGTGGVTAPKGQLSGSGTVVLRPAQPVLIPPGFTSPMAFTAFQPPPAGPPPFITGSGGVTAPKGQLSGFGQAGLPFPAGILGLLVELNVGGTWTDITSFVQQRAPLSITRGRPDESGNASPSSLTLTVRNDGRFTPKNPAGAWYGLIGRNTQIRVSAQDSPAVPFGMIYRCWLEIPEWPPRWDPSGADVYVQLTAAGVLRRLAQNASLKSPLTRYYAGLTGGAVPLAYWPCEDGAAASSLVSGVPGGQPMTFTGLAQLSSDSSFAGAAALPQFNGAVFTGLTGASGSVVAVSQDVFNSSGTWVAPPGITQVVTNKWGAGGGGSTVAGGGGGGEFAQDVQPVTPGHSYAVAVGTSSTGANGGNSSFTGDTGIATAHGGRAGSGASGGAGGTGSTSSIHHDGGAGSAGTAGTGDPPVQQSQTFTSSDTWQAPAAIIGSPNVYLWGGGGGGGAGTDGAHGGGSAGGGGFSAITPTVTPGNSYSITVGAGGTAGTSSTSSTDGGSSKFNGGSTTSGGSRGTANNFGAAGGGLTHDGGPGAFSGTSLIGAGGGGGGSLGGDGGAGIFGGSGGAGGHGGAAGGLIAGGAGGNGGTSGSKTGKAGSAPGGGGGGGYATGNSSGGNGGSGRVEIFWSEDQGGGTPSVAGGGGSSGGTASAGNAGATQAGAAAVPGGGPGGGVLAGSTWTARPTAGPGGGGGGADGGGPAGPGAAGQVQVIYAPAGTGSGAAANIMRFLLHINSSGEADGAIVASMLTTGTVARVDVVYNTGGTLTMNGLNSAGGTLFSSGPVAFGADGKLLLVSAELVASGGDIAWQLTGLQQGSTVAGTITPASASGTLSSATVGNAFAWTGNSAGTLMSTGFGHVAIQQSTSPALADVAGPFAAWAGELAADRFTRLCTEEGIPVLITGTAADTQMVGPQTIAQLVQLLQDCEDADQGLIYEPRTQFGLAYRTRVDLCNQDPAVTLNYAAADLSDELDPDYNDQKIFNDWTVSRPSGSSSEQALLTGPMSVQDPPDGVSSYTNTKTANVATDGQLPDLASWLLHTTTVDELRFPAIMLNLARPESADNFTDLATTDIGDRVVIQNPPSWLPPEQISQLVFGVTETLNAKQWQISYNAVPESPYQVALAGDDARLDTDGSLLGTGIGTGDTTFSVSTPVQNAPWVCTANNPDEFPFDVTIAGEQMTVLEIDGATSPQTFQVTRSVNGIQKAHTAGEAINLTSPAIVSL